MLASCLVEQTRQLEKVQQDLKVRPTGCSVVEIDNYNQVVQKI